MLKFYMWNILSLNYERRLIYLKKKKKHSSFSLSALCLNTFAKFNHKYMIHLEVKQQLVYFADLLKSKVPSPNPANY